MAIVRQAIIVYINKTCSGFHLGTSKHLSMYTISGHSNTMLYNVYMPVRRISARRIPVRRIQLDADQLDADLLDADLLDADLLDASHLDYCIF